MPTWFDYEKESEEIDESLEKQKRRRETWMKKN